MIGLRFYLYILIIAGIIVAILGIFKSSILYRLNTRIAALILASGPITFLLFRIADEFIQEWRIRNYGATLAAYILIALGSPIVLGLLAAHFVRRPLRQFSDAVASLEKNNYKVQLQPSGIHEFDEVFAKFNSLIDRLQREEKLRKNLVSDTSHELNTPLTAMIGQLTAMQEGKHSITKERLTILKEEAERLADLVQQLDAYAKARIPATGLSEDILLKQFCEQLLSNFSVELRQKGISAKIDIADDHTIHASRDALQRILTNFVQNTLRYSEANEITITTTAHQLVFSDNGKGVPAESLPYLFERFYRVDKSRNRATGGLGLGLAIVKELAEQQGWHVHAKNARPGVAFVLTLK